MVIRANLILTDNILRSGDSKRTRVFPWACCTEAGRKLFSLTWSMGSPAAMFLRFLAGVFTTQDSAANKQREARRKERGTKSVVLTLRPSLQFFLYF